MTRPRPMPPAMSAAFANALDLSALKRPPAGSSPDRVPSSSAYVIDVDETSFASQVIDLSASVLVIVDLWATWCEPCKQLSPILERVVDEFNGAVVLAKVDVDVNPRIAQAFQVQSVPTVVAVAQGKPVDAFSGAQPEPAVRQWIGSIVQALRESIPGFAVGGAPSEAEPEVEDLRFTAAEAAIESGDFPAAIAAYQEILAAEPHNIEAAAALGHVTLQLKVSHLPADTLARADADLADAKLQCDAADLLIAQGQIEAAFARLVDTVRRTSGDERVLVREHLLELFTLIGPEEPAVVAARRALAAALY